MYMVVNCSSCRTPLQIPQGASSIRCIICQSITLIVSPHSSDSSSSLSNPHAPAPSPYSHAPPSPHGRKKAVICGISYRSSKNELEGCVNDAKCMRYLLINKFQFPSDSIVMLTEEETDPFKIPTKHNIRMALFWLVNGCQPGDSLVFHFSGHGSRQRNYNGDEVDGYDGTLCPLDFETQGMIIDDEVNATIVRPLPRGVKLHAIVDACHSGTVLDLSYLCRMNRHGEYAWEDHRPPSGTWKGSNGGEVISFSGCDDNQTSADTSALSKITSTGAMTYCFIQAIERGKASTYGSMLTSMRSAIRKIGNRSDIGSGGFTSLMSMLINGVSLSGGLRQEPQLTSCEMFDVYTKPFAL